MIIVALFFFIQIISSQNGFDFAAIPFELLSKIGFVDKPINIQRFILDLRGSEDLYFSSTGPVEFVRENIISQKVSKFFLKDLYEDCKVLPDPQCWVHEYYPYDAPSFYARIDKDVDQIRSYFDLPVSDYKRYDKVFHCWDSFFYNGCLYSAIVTEHSVKFLSISKMFSNSLFHYDHSNKIVSKPSLCFHNRFDTLESSLIDEKSMKIFNIEWFLSVQDIHCSLKEVRKHEYIGAGTYLLLTTMGVLFFAHVHNDELIFKKQTIKNTDDQEYFVHDFSANQDHDKKTSNGRARFFVLYTKGGKVFLCDLLARYKYRSRNGVSYLPITFLLGNDDISYNQGKKISFSKSSVFLWSSKMIKGNNYKNFVYKVELDNNWHLLEMTKICRFTDNKYRSYFFNHTLKLWFKMMLQSMYCLICKHLKKLLFLTFMVCFSFVLIKKYHPFKSMHLKIILNFCSAAIPTD